MNAQATGILDPPVADKPPGKLAQLLTDLKESLKVWKWGAKEWSAATVGSHVSDAKWLGILWLMVGKEAPALAAIAMQKVLLFTKVFVVTAAGLTFNSTT